MQAPFWLATSGVVIAYILYVAKPAWPGLISQKLSLVHRLLMHKYGFDSFNENVVARFTRFTSSILADKFDMGFIDNGVVNGAARTVGAVSRVMKKIQHGYLYNYTFLMIFGLLMLVMLVLL